MRAALFLEGVVAVHLGEMLWGNIGAADRLDFTAIGPAVNLAAGWKGYAGRSTSPSLSRAHSPPRPEHR